MTDNTETRPSIGTVQVGIALLALGTAGIHLYLFLIEGFLGNGEMLPIYQLLFVGNFFAYVTLAAALALPISPLARFRSFIRTLLIAIAVASIASYFYVGCSTSWATSTKLSRFCSSCWRLWMRPRPEPKEISPDSTLVAP